VAYPNNNVKIVGTAPGLTQGSNGGTHMCFLDLALMRAMPNMHVYSPCDAYELRAIMRHMAATKQPTYLQLVRYQVPAVFDDSYQFEPYRARTLREGGNVTLATTGYMVPYVLTAADELAKQGIKADVLHYPSVKPFDAETLVASAKKTGGVVTVENQTTIGGLGGAVCETLSERHPVRVKRLGVPDKFGEVATEDYLFEKHGFGVKHIVEAAKNLAN
jgi:transketolase